MLNKNIKYMAGVCAFMACLFACLEYSYSEEPGEEVARGKEERPAMFTMAFTAYYANWAPVWKKFHKIFPVYTEGDYSLPKGAFMYGPSVSVKINRWQIAGNFLYGEFEGNLYSYRYLPDLSGTGTAFILPYRTTLKTKKYDSDLLISYQINTLFKIFFGPKYQGYHYKKEILKIFITQHRMRIYAIIPEVWAPA